MKELTPQNLSDDVFARLQEYRRSGQIPNAYLVNMADNVLSQLVRRTNYYILQGIGYPPEANEVTAEVLKVLIEVLMKNYDGGKLLLASVGELEAICAACRIDLRAEARRYL